MTSQKITVTYMVGDNEINKGMKIAKLPEVTWESTAVLQLKKPARVTKAWRQKIIKCFKESADESGITLSDFVFKVEFYEKGTK